MNLREAFPPSEVMIRGRASMPRDPNWRGESIVISCAKRFACKGESMHHNVLYDTFSATAGTTCHLLISGRLSHRCYLCASRHHRVGNGLSGSGSCSWLHQRSQGNLVPSRVNGPTHVYRCTRTVPKHIELEVLGLALSEKQIPQIVENNESGTERMEPLEGTEVRPRQGRTSLLGVLGG